MSGIPSHRSNEIIIEKNRSNELCFGLLIFVFILVKVTSLDTCRFGDQRIGGENHTVTGANASPNVGSNFQLYYYLPSFSTVLHMFWLTHSLVYFPTINVLLH